MSMASIGHCCLPMSRYFAGHSLVICITDIPSSNGDEMILHQVIGEIGSLWKMQSATTRLCKVSWSLRTIY